MEHVAAVEPADDFPGGFVKAGVQRRIEALIGLIDDASYVLLIIADDIESAVSRAIVYDNILEIGITLTEDRTEGVFQETFAIVDGGDKRDARPRHFDRTGGGFVQSLSSPCDSLY
jgi:hypothetical protein